MRKMVKAAQRLRGSVGMAALALMLTPALALAGTTGPATAHFGFLDTALTVAEGAIKPIALLAMVGGIVMWGVGGGGEGVMKKVGPVIAAFGLAAFILSQAQFLGIGGATF